MYGPEGVKNFIAFLFNSKALRTDIVRGFTKVGENSKTNNLHPETSNPLGKAASVPTAKKLAILSSPKIISKINSRRASPTKLILESKKDLSESLSPTHKSPSSSFVKAKKSLPIDVENKIRRPGVTSIISSFIYKFLL